MEVTSLFISKIPMEKSEKISSYGFEEFISDGTLILRYLEYVAEELPKSLQILKMRGTNHSTEIHGLEIGRNGISVKIRK